MKPDAFAAYLRKVEVAPNGHPNTERRQLRDKGVQFILETCRSMYTFALKRRHLPPYAENPFSELPLDRLKVQDAKPIFVFTAATELAFLRAAGRWAFRDEGLLSAADIEGHDVSPTVVNFNGDGHRLPRRCRRRPLLLHEGPEGEGRRTPTVTGHDRTIARCGNRAIMRRSSIISRSRRRDPEELLARRNRRAGPRPATGFIRVSQAPADCPDDRPQMSG